ncbi:MAG: Sorbitol dehydrogenase, partial [uncultured Solirubrobacteraceae bacterium]
GGGRVPWATRLPDGGGRRAGAGSGRGARPRRGLRHLRERPQVLPRRLEVLGRRDPPGVGRDRGHPRARVRRRGRAPGRGGRHPLGDRRGRPRRLGADRPVLGVPLLPARPVPHVRAARHLRLQAPDAGRHGAVHDLPRPGAGAQGLQGPARRPCRLRRAALVLAARGGAGEHLLRGRRRGGGLRPDRPRHGGRGEGQGPGPRGRPRHGGPQARARAGLRCRQHREHRPRGPAGARQAAHRRLRRGRLPRGDGPPVRRGAGADAPAQARHLRRVQRLQGQRLRRLERHLRRQGARRPRGPPRAPLLAGRHPDDRVRPPPDGPHLHPPASAGAVRGGPRPRGRRLLLDQGLAHPVM